MGLLTGHGTGTEHARTQELTRDELPAEVRVSLRRFLK